MTCAWVFGHPQGRNCIGPRLPTFDHRQLAEQLPLVGAVDQLADSTDLLSSIDLTPDCAPSTASSLTTRRAHARRYPYPDTCSPGIYRAARDPWYWWVGRGGGRVAHHQRHPYLTVVRTEVR
jgi:hypothetical protein